MMNTSIDIYILGLLYFRDDTQETLVFENHENATIAMEFTKRLEWEYDHRSGKDEIYCLDKLTKEKDSTKLRKFFGEDLVDKIDEVQFGYYHHRAIFKVKCDKSKSFEEIRKYRHQIHSCIRTNCFDYFTGRKVELKNRVVEICYIYSYILLLVPHGDRIVSVETEKLRNQGWDQIYSTESTAFCFAIVEKLGFCGLKLKQHFVRISVPSTIIYLNGNQISRTLLYKIMNGIYYGGLYQKIKLDRQSHKETGTYLPNYRWPHDLMIKTYELLSENINNGILTYLSNRIDRYALLLAGIGILIAVITCILSRK